MTIQVTLPSTPQLPSPDPTGAGGGHLPGNSDGSWGGPVGEAVAKALEEGYRDKAKPFHGYYFEVLKDSDHPTPRTTRVRNRGSDDRRFCTGRRASLPQRAVDGISSTFL